MARGGKSRSESRGGSVRMQETSVRGGSISMQGRTTRSAIQERQTRYDPPAPVQQPREIPAPPMIPPRMPSQRILLKKLSAPVEGPGSTPDSAFP